MKYYLSALRNYANFSGRARRGEYWYFVLFNLLFGLGILFLGTLFGMLFSPALATVFSMLYLAYAIFALVPGVAVTVRRLHDTNRSGWLILISLIPLIGSILLLVWLATDSEWGDNQYGKYPKEEISHLVSF